MKQLDFFFKHKARIAEILTEQQYNSFFALIEGLTASFMFIDYSYAPPQEKASFLLLLSIAMALAKDIDIDDPRVKDAISVYSHGLGIDLAAMAIASKEDFIPMYINFYNKHALKYRCNNEFSGDDFQIPVKHYNEIKSLATKQLRQLIYWVPVIDEFTTPDVILKNLFKGGVVVSINKVSAHGVTKGHQFTSFIHDVFHYISFATSVITSLAEHTCMRINASAAQGLRVTELSDLEIKKSKQIFVSLFQGLADLQELVCYVGNYYAQAGLFLLFHENNAWFSAKEWNFYNNITKLLECGFDKIKKMKFSSWFLAEDHFFTNPITGEVSVSDERLIEFVKQNIEEFKVVENLTKQLATLQGPQKTRFLQKLAVAEKKLSLINISIVKNKRFVSARVSRTYALQDEYIHICSTLYHKRRNAWDIFLLLKGEQGTGIPRPDSWGTRVETLKNLKKLYEDLFFVAIQEAIFVSRHKYQLTSKRYEESTMLLSPLARYLTGKYNKQFYCFVSNLGSKHESKYAKNIKLTRYKNGYR